MPLRTLLERGAASMNVTPASRPIETSSSFATALLLNKSSKRVALMPRETVDFFESIRSGAEPYGMVTRQGSSQLPLVADLRESIRAQASRLN